MLKMNWKKIRNETKWRAQHWSEEVDVGRWRWQERKRE